jgi:hypothetical protein
MHNEFTAVIEQDGEWFIAYCPEITGANGQGRTRQECLDSLASAIAGGRQSNPKFRSRRADSGGARVEESWCCACRPGEGEPMRNELTAVIKQDGERFVAYCPETMDSACYTADHAWRRIWQLN